jgi:SAM-dependent methyltransferase
VRRDALELDRFYRSRQGRTARRMILRRLKAVWPEMRDLDALGIGFATPYFAPYRDEARRCISLMPGAQGAVIPAHGASTIALGDETHLPFAEALFDRVLLVHAMEEAESLPALLRETWRVLAPEGRMVIVVPARAGIWAWLDSTPFGHGRPFSKAQLSHLLDDAMFETTAWSRALYAPPWGWSTGPRTAQFWENTGEQLWAGLGGVVLVEAVKRTAALRPRGNPVVARIRRLEGQATPALSPPPTRHDASDN